MTPRTRKAIPYSWIAVALCLLAQIGVNLITQGLPVLYPFIQNELGLSRPQIGLITSCLMAGGALAILAGGWLTDTLGTKRVIIAILAGAGALMVLLPLATSFTGMLLLVALIGIAVGPMYPASTGAIMDWSSGRVLGLALSVMQTGAPVAGVLTAAALPALAVALGWRISAGALGAAILVIALVFMISYRGVSKKGHLSVPMNPAVLRALLHNRGLVILTVWAFTFAGLQAVAMSYFILFLIDVVGSSPVTAGGTLAVAQVASCGARILWGAASDFIFRGRRMSMLVVLGIIATVELLAISLVGTGFSTIALFLLALALGISIFAWHGVLTALIGEMASAGQVGTTVGAIGSLMFAGMMVAPPLFGQLVDMSSYATAWRAAGAAALVSTLGILVFGRDKHRPTRTNPG